MANQSSIGQAAQLNALYQAVTTAITVLNGSNPQIILEVSSDSYAAQRVVGLNLAPATLITLLQNRQTAIANQLTALGYTVGS
jgi:hypothetical protein